MLEMRLKEIREEFEQFEDSFSQYAFLVELSAYVPPEQPDLTIEANRFKGCQSQVWLTMHAENGIFQMKATSDTLILRGLLYVMMELYNGCTLTEIAEHPIDLLSACGIERHFTSERTIGIRGITEKIYEFCQNPQTF